MSLLLSNIAKQQSFEWLTFNKKHSITEKNETREMKKPGQTIISSDCFYVSEQIVQLAVRFANVVLFRSGHYN